jgi:hypothetical protein
MWKWRASRPNEWHNDSPAERGRGAITMDPENLRDQLSKLHEELQSARPSIRKSNQLMLEVLRTVLERL